MFVAYEVSIELIRELRPVVGRIRAHDADLAKQMRRAATSICQAVGEGRKRVGQDRMHLFRIADGSAGEVEAGLDAAVAWGYLDQEPKARVVLDRMKRLLWGLTH